VSYSHFLCSYGSGSDPIINDDFLGGSVMGSIYFLILDVPKKGEGQAALLRCDITQWSSNALEIVFVHYRINPRRRTGVAEGP
jgi:hypothetical protein